MKDTLSHFRLLFFVFLIFQFSTIKGQQPNIVFILADDLGWADLPSYGNRFNESPNLDRLAKDGTRFTDAYSAAPVCSPGRAAILTGQYPARVGITDFIPGHWRPFEKVIVPKNKTQFLPAEKGTIGEMLKTAGYTTGYFGKWHLGNAPKQHPLQRGFDDAAVGQGYYNVRYSPERPNVADNISSEQLADFGIQFIEQSKQEPFFLFISYFDVHVPYDAKAELIDKYLGKEKVAEYPCNALYAASIEQMDQSIGRIIDKLEKEGLLANTIIIFTSDNGGSVSENKYPGIREGKYPVIHPSKRGVYAADDPLQYMGTSNTPLRNEKGTVYEGGIRVPLIVSWPERVKANVSNDEPVTGVDFYPTLADVAGVATHLQDTVDGVSLMPLLAGQTLARSAIYWHYPVYHHGEPASAIRSKDWKLIHNMVTDDYALYNLRIDISETTDLSAVYVDKSKQLKDALHRWQREVNAAFPKPNPNFDEGKRSIWSQHPDRPKH